MFYRQLRKGVNDDSYQLISEDDLLNHVKLGSPFQDYYTSIYKYTEDQYQQFLKTRTIKKVKDVITDRLVFDFDSDDLDVAKKDAIEICDRLISKGILQDNLRISFSGNKGFHVEVYLNENLTVDEFKAVTKQLANGLQSFDKRINDYARPFRILGTINKSSNLYKIPLTLNELCTCSIDEIKHKAKSMTNINKEDFKNWGISILPENIKQLKTFSEEYKPKVKEIKTDELDWSIKPKFLTNCRWSLQNGFFAEGERNSAFLCLAATYKNYGYAQEIAYRMLKGVAEIQASRSSCEKYSADELYNNIILQVYSDDWKGGQFTCRKEENWLFDYCQSLGKHKCNHKEEDQLKPKKLSDIHESFKNYVVNIEKNTIKTGIPSLDETVFLSTGANVGIIGAPGSGKTSLALDIVSNTSKTGVHSVLASLDMHYNRLFEKTLYRITGYDREKLYEVFKNNQEQEIMEKLNEEFGNVNFFHKSCPTVNDLREYILACQEASGEKIKLVMLDYFERVTSDLSDDTAASKRVAGELQDLVNDLDICLVTLVQPNKMSLSGGPETPITSYTSIKGSSYVYQAFRIIISLWRPFYSPKTFENDRFMQMAILKNDLGELSELSFGWNGKRGLIFELDDGQQFEFKELLDKQKLADTEPKGF